MPRTAGASIGEICYHVLNRGNARKDVFHEDDDHQRFIELRGKKVECSLSPRDIKGRFGDPRGHITRESCRITRYYRFSPADYFLGQIGCFLVFLGCHGFSKAGIPVLRGVSG